MKFWTRLRWIATIAFLLLLVASWTGSDPPTSPRATDTLRARPAPVI